uniref:Asialoglycoprotein receptor 1-like n=1 Tax=Geotrypetes seraphini TaxID=260995 RepID=A0A6P8NKQ4_GEOSA|nr:asialoglycoprotein receptor 1-like [Geotrypetes seraphini]
MGPSIIDRKRGPPVQQCGPLPDWQRGPTPIDGKRYKQAASGSDVSFPINLPFCETVSVLVQSEEPEPEMNLPTLLYLLALFIVGGRTRGGKTSVKTGSSVAESAQGMVTVFVQIEGEPGQRAEVSVQTEAIPSKMSSASTQTEPIDQPDESLMIELRSLREEIQCLRSIRDDETFIDGIIQELSQIAEREPDKTILESPRASRTSDLNPTVGIQEVTGDADTWQLVTSSTGNCARENCLCAQGFCATGWVQYKDACYMNYTTRMSWVDAEAKCQSINSHLASIHSVEENDFIYALMGKIHNYKAGLAYWIGGFDTLKEGLYMWTDGSSWDFATFGSGQPDNFRNEDYIGSWFPKNGHITWNDYLSNSSFPFVCKYSLKNRISCESGPRKT